MLLRWPRQLCITYGTKIVKKIPVNTSNQGLKAQNAVDLELLKRKLNDDNSNMIAITITTIMIIVVIRIVTISNNDNDAIINKSLYPTVDQRWISMD